METLLKPDLGLMIWTVVTFLVLVFILGKVVWKPLLNALDEREGKIQQTIQSAQGMQQAAQELKAQYDQELARLETRAQELLSQAQKEAEKNKERMIQTAQEEAKELSVRTKQQLQEEKARLIQELRSEVSRLSLVAAEKLLKRSINKKIQEEFIQDALDDLDEPSREIH